MISLCPLSHGPLLPAIKRNGIVFYWLLIVGDLVTSP